MTANLADLTRRLDELEARFGRQQALTRRYRRLTLGLGAMIFAGVTIAAAVDPDGAPPPDRRFGTIQARQIEIIDNAGNLVWQARGGASGGEMDFWTPQGQNTMRLSTNNHGGDFALWSRDGVSLFSAFSTATGGEIGVWNTAGRQLLRAGCESSGGRLELRDADDHITVAAGSRPNGGVMSVFNTGGQAVVTSRVNDHGGEIIMNGSDGALTTMMRTVESGGVFTANNNNGTPVATLEVDPTGNGASILRSSTGQPRVLEQVTSNRGSVSIFNESGKDVANLTATNEGGGRMELANQEGEIVLSAQAVHNQGSTLELANARGKRLFVVGVDENGAVFNLLNKYAVPVVIGGYAEDGRSGALTIRNGRGLDIVYAGGADAERGQVKVWNAESEKARELNPLP
ncbi:MAG: hypothetical protein KC983_01105 [Phycisphaerales bacterium]|nr:hypothetical protein [Phycisphaerales bacterium]